MRRTGCSAVAAALSGLLALALATEAHGFALQEHGPISLGAAPSALAAGADGTMWFTEAGPGEGAGPVGIGRVASDGAVTEFREGLREGASPRQMVRGAGGVMWFRDWGSVGRITRDGVITEFPVGRADGVLGADDAGTVWLVGSHTVGRVTSSGSVETHRSAFPGRAGTITVADGGPGHRLWVTNGPWLGSIAPGGKETWRRFAGVRDFDAIAPGPDGRLWLATHDGRLLRADRRGRRAAPVPAPRLHRVAAMAAGPGRSMWIAQPGTDQVAQVDVRGHVTLRGHGSRRHLRARAIARDGRGRMWLAGEDRVVRAVPGPTCAVVDVVTHSVAVARRTFERSGCRLRIVHETSDGAGPRRVVAQSAPGGQVLHRGATVTLTEGPLACRFGTGWEVAQRSALAAVAVRSTRNGERTQTQWRGCLLARGVPRTVAGTSDDGSGFSDFAEVSVRLAGRWILTSTLVAGRYDRYDEFLDLVDLASSRPAGRVVLLPAGHILAGSALSETGVVAWVERDGPQGQTTGLRSIFVTPPGGETRQVRDGATDVDDLRIDDTAVYWTEDGVEHSAPIGE